MKQEPVKLAVAGLALAWSIAGAPAARAEKPAEGRSDFEFRMMDTNGDGKVSEAEHAAGATKMFGMMDADKDGKVTTAEMEAAHAKVAGKAATKAADTEKKSQRMSAADKLKVVDTNHDGVLSADEHAAGSKMMFEKMDTNKDGFLTKAELEAGHARLMSKAPGRPPEP